MTSLPAPNLDLDSRAPNIHLGECTGLPAGGTSPIKNRAYVLLNRWGTLRG